MWENTASDLYPFFSEVHSRVWIALHISNLSNTLHVSRWEKVGYLEKAGSRGWHKGHVELIPAGQDAARAVCRESGMLGHLQNWQRSRLVSGRARGWQQLGQYSGKVSINAQNLATCLGRKSRNTEGITWGMEGRNSKTSTDHGPREWQNNGKLLEKCHFLHHLG